MKRTWANELWRLLGVALVGLLAGALLGHALAGALVLVTCYLGWHVSQLVVLRRWLGSGAKRSAFPELAGVWHELAQYVYQIKKRSQKRKRRLTNLLSRFNASAGALPDAVVILASHGEIEWANRASQVLLGVHPRDIGQRIDNLLRDPAFHAYLAGGDYEREFEYRSPLRRGLVLGVRIVPFAERSRLLTARDMSEQARVRRMRRDFVANVSHELRTPLTVISGYFETFETDRDLPPYLHEHLEHVNSQVRRMNRLVEDLLTLSTLESSELAASEGQALALDAVLAGLIEDARSMGAVTGHVLSLEATPRLGVRGSETELTSVLANLIYNAVQHTPQGTRVAVRWRRTNDGGAEFEVQDNGPGIAPEHLGRLTERFYRIDAGRSRERGGTGLGLSIVKHVLQRHGAELFIDSEVGRGSSFRCRFPAERVAEIMPHHAASA